MAQTETQGHASHGLGGTIPRFTLRPLPTRRLGRITALLVALLAIAGGNFCSVVALQTLQESEIRISRTQELMLALDDLRDLIQDADVNRLLFQITGELQFAEASRRAWRAGRNMWEHVRELAEHSPQRVAELARVQVLLDQNVERLRREISERPVNGTIDPSFVKTGEHAQQSAEFAASIAEVEANERRVLEQRVATADRSRITALVLMAIGTAGGLALTAVLFGLTRRDAHATARLVKVRTQELRAANAALAESEAQLRQREEHLRLLIDAAPAPVAMLDRDMRYLAYSQRFVADFRLSGEGDLHGRSHYELFPEIPERWRESYRQCLAGVCAQCDEDEFRRANGEVDWVRWEIRPWRESHGSIGGLILFSEVITERKRAEQALAESERQLRNARNMDSMGKLTGGVAHDFNNLLGVITLNAEFLADAVAGDARHLPLVNEILRAAQGGTDLTRRLLAFGRRQVLRPSKLDLNQHVSELLPILQRTLGEAVRVTTEFEPALWRTCVDPSQIDDALLNLVINARDAMPHGGSLIIGTSNAHLDDDYTATQAEVVAGDYVRLSVTDTGVGMTPEVLERATEPFFSTKPVGEGSGLGLSMIYGFARQSGGHLKLYSEPGRGTTVHLYLPQDRQVGMSEEPTRPEEPVRGGTETILLADDNAELRTIAERYLTSLGYRVIVAEHGPAALAVLAAGMPVDLLFTDLVMPEGMTGQQLAAAARQYQPDLKVVYTTGYAASPPSGPGAVPVRERMLRKPYRRQDLARAMRSALESQTAPVLAGSG